MGQHRRRIRQECRDHARHGLKGGARHACSVCADQNERENWEHFWRCRTWRPTWQKFVDLANELEGEHHAGHTEACIYLGIDGTGEAFKGTLGLLHKLVWKFIIMEFTKASIEGTQIQHETIWKRAMRRLATRINAQGRRVQRRNLSTEGRGTRSKWEKLNKRMGPMAHLDPDSGEVIWNPALRTDLQALHILGTEDGPSMEEEEDREMEAQGEEEEEDQHERAEGGGEEDEEPPDPWRDENEEY